MFIAPHFAETDHGLLHGLIRAHSFGLLLTVADGRPFGSHLPFILDAERGPHGTLIAHMARANPQWRAFDGATEVLAVFQGPHAYVSPSWYDPTVNTVPTWNYAVVHAYGVPEIIADPEVIRAMLDHLVAEHEAGADSPWTMASQPDSYLESMQKGIVAFDIPIARLEGKFKLNQNHGEANRKGAIAGLKRSGDSMSLEVAALMEARETAKR